MQKLATPHKKPAKLHSDPDYNIVVGVFPVIVVGVFPIVVVGIFFNSYWNTNDNEVQNDEMKHVNHAGICS